jgi:uncharacterized protein (TIGR00251 family)
MTDLRKFELHDGKKGAAIAVRVTPRMAKNQVYAIMDDGTIKVRLTAPPVEGKANKALIRFLAEILEIPLSAIEIVAGQTGHDKLVTIYNMSSEDVQQKLLHQLSTQ